jgi:hypothetical protein
MSPSRYFALLVSGHGLVSWCISDSGILTLCAALVLGLGKLAFFLIRLWLKYHPIIVLHVRTVPHLQTEIESKDEDDDKPELPRAA